MLALVVLLALAVLLWNPMKRALDTAALQKVLPCNELNIRYATEPKMPWLQHQGWRLIDFIYGHNPNGGATPANKIMTARYASMFGGRVWSIWVSDLRGVGRDVKSALARFPDTKYVHVTTISRAPSEADWAYLCAGLRELPELEILDLSVHGLTAHAITPLAGHPALMSVSLDLVKFDTECLETLASMPRLTEVNVRDSMTTNELTEAEWGDRCAALREMERLEKITIAGRMLTDDAFARLAGHPSLRILHLWDCHLTSKSISTLASMPKLSELIIQQADHPHGFTPEERAPFVSALPAVNLEF